MMEQKAGVIIFDKEDRCMGCAKFFLGLCAIPLLFDDENYCLTIVVKECKLRKII